MLITQLMTTTTKALIVSAVLPWVKDDFDRLDEKTSSKVCAALGLTTGPTLTEWIREPIKECWNKDDSDKMKIVNGSKEIKWEYARLVYILLHLRFQINLSLSMKVILKLCLFRGVYFQNISSHSHVWGRK